ALADQCDTVLEVAIRPEGRQPAIGQRPDLLDGLLLQRSDEERDVRTQRIHLELELARVEEAAELRAQAFAAPQRAHDADRLAEPRERLLVGGALRSFDAPVC